MGAANGQGPMQPNAPEGRSRRRPLGHRRGRSSAMGVLAVAVLTVTTLVLLPAPTQALPVTSAADPATDSPAEPAGTDAVAAAAGAPSCDTTYASGLPSTTTCTYTYEVGRQWWPKPAEVGRVSVVVNGAQGGNSTSAGGGSPGVGGKGGQLTGTIDVSAQDGLWIIVGGQGQSGQVGGAGGAGGQPDGGAGGTATASSSAGCGGGGSSLVYLQSVTLFRAGGGGGCGGYYTPMAGANGGRGGLQPGGGATGASVANLCDRMSGTGGGPASATAGGGAGAQGQYLGGDFYCYNGGSHSAQAGMSETGGYGSAAETTNGTGGGGGGGGAFGGGGGGGGRNNLAEGSGGGGGGGGGISAVAAGSIVTSSAGTNDVQTGNGSVSITYEYARPTTTVTAVGGATSVPAGGSVTFVATVESPSWAGPPRGTVTFRDDAFGERLCEGSPIPVQYAGRSATSVWSTASCTFTNHNTVPTPPQCLPPTETAAPPTPTACTFTTNQAYHMRLVAEYAGGDATWPSRSSAYEFDVTPVSTTTALTVGTDANVVDIDVATVGTDTVRIDGSVTVRDADDSAIEGCVDLPLTWAAGSPHGTQTCYVAPIAGRPRHLTATYTAGWSTQSSTSAVLDLAAPVIGTTTDLSIVDGPRAYGHPITATAQVALAPPMPGATLDGSVTFTDSVDGATPVPVPGCVDLLVPSDSNGVVGCTVAHPVVGTHVLHARYAGAAQTTSSDSPDRSVAMTAATPRATVVADPPGGASAGQFVALTGRVELSDGTSDHVAVVEGTVTFRDRGVDIPGCTAMPVDRPTVTCSLQPAVTTGSAPHSFTVHHLGSANLQPASSPALSYAVGLAASRTVLALVTPASASVPAGTEITVAATVTATIAGVTPSGNVAFFDNGQPIAACPPPRPLDGSGRATCTYVPTAGAGHALTAAFQPVAGGTTAASSTTSVLAVTVARFASTTALVVTPDATPTTPVVGDEVVLTAAVTTSGAGPIPTGTIAFRDGGSTLAGCDAVPIAPVPGASPAAAIASCAIEPGGGSHSFGASFSGDAPTGPSLSPSVAYAVLAVATTTDVSATPSGETELTLAATVTPASGSAIPAGSVDLSVDGASATDECREVPLVATAGGATASCRWTGDPTVAHTIDATYAPDGGDFTASTGSFSFEAPGACRAGEDVLWAQLDSTPGGVVVSDGASSLTIAVEGGPGGCQATPVPFEATSISLFGGLLTGSGSGVLTGAATSGSVCLTEGSLTPPEWMSVPTMDITAPICWTLQDDGDLGSSTQGELAIVGAEGRFPFVALDDLPAAAASFTFTADGPDGASELQVRFVAGDPGAPVLDMGLTVSSEGTFSGTLDTPGLVLFGQSLSTLHAEISGGGGATLRLEGSVTIGPIDIADGMTIDELTVALSTDGFEVDGIASVGVGDHILQLTAAGTVTSRNDWSLELSVRDSEAWEPLPGLVLSPALRGSISRTDGEYAFDLEAGDPDGSPLVAWQPSPGASIAVQTIHIASEGIDCAAVPDGPEHEGDLVLAFVGELNLSGTTVAIDGCADLSIGAYHLQATASEIEVSSELVVSNLDLTADGAVGAGLELTGGGDATISGHDVHLRFALASSGALVVGASVDLAAWGVPVQGFVAYTSADVAGFDTGDPTVGDEGVVDLEAGLTAVALWTPDAEADALLSAPAPDGLGLTAGGGIRFTAHIGPGSLVFTAEIQAPTELPFLTLPGGTTIDEAALTFTRTGAENTLGLHVAATVQTTTAVTVDLVLGLSDGSFTGEVDVTDLQLFGRTDIALHGSIERSPNSAGVMEVQASVAGSVGSEDDPIEVAPSVSFTRLDLTLGTGGIAVAGDVVIADKGGLAVEGRVFTKADPASGFGAGGWSLEVSTSEVTEWSPTDGVTFTADLSGSIEKKTSVTPVSFRLEAEGPDGGNLFTFTPGDAPVTVAVRRVAIANAAPAPAACAARPGDVWLSIDGSLTATIGGRDGTATASGCFDLTSGAMSVAADLSDFSVDLGSGVRVRGPRFTVARTASTPPPAPGTSRFTVRAEVAIDLDLLGTPYTSPAPGTAATRLTAQLSYSGSAVVVGVRANLGSYGLGGVGGDAYLYYASAPVTGFATGDPALSKIDPKTGTSTNGKIDLVRGINFAVRLTLPASVTEGLGQTGGDEGVDAPTGAVTAIGQIDSAAKAFTFKIQFKSGVGGQELLRTGNGTRLTLDDGFLKFTVKSGQTSFGLGIAATLHLPPVEEAGEETHVPLTGELTVSTTGINASLQLGTCGSPETAWRNAFGMDGLTVECAAIQGGISYGGLPTIGFFGKVTGLPSDVASAIGYVQGAPMQFAFNLNPMMLSISIGVKDSKDVALRPLQAFGKPDMIQVRYASLYVAPVAVTIGQQTFPAGFGIGFQASIAGVDMNILASVDPSTPSISMLAEVSEIEIGALKLGPVKVDLLASPTEFRFVVDGTLSLGPGSTDIGPALKVGGELSVSVHVSILPSGFEAYVWGHAAMKISTLLPQEVCWYGGQIPIPCTFSWSDAGFDVTLPKTGFAVDGKGISLIAGGYRITMLWEGGLTASSADSIEAKLEQARLEAELRKQAGTSPAASTASLAVDDADLAAEDDDTLVVAAPAASDEPMAAAPLAAELAIPASSLLAGASILAPPSGPNPAGDMPILDTTTSIVIDPVPVPLLAEGVAPGEWTPTGGLQDARTNAAIATLPDGRVLVAGGGGADGPLASAEIYDPATGSWASTGSLTNARSGAGVAVLPDGRILLAGGTDSIDGAPGDHALDSVEIYDAATGRWSTGAALGEGRTHATTTVLDDGSVLVAGGLGPDGSLATAERYDPAPGRWHAVGSLTTARGLASASLLADGRVLIAGGLGTAAPIASSEVFDPATELWHAVADMPSASMLDTATTLADGRVLVAGSDARGKLYDPGTNSWSWTGAVGSVRTQATAVTLPDGDVLLIGGTAAGQVATDAVIYDTATNSWQSTTVLPTGTASAAAVVLPDGSVLAVGGADRTTPLAAASVYRQVSAPTGAAAPVAATTGQLPATGSDVLAGTLLALALVAAGSAAVATTRRRRQL